MCQATPGTQNKAALDTKSKAGLRVSCLGSARSGGCEKFFVTSQYTFLTLLKERYYGTSSDGSRSLKVVEALENIKKDARNGPDQKRHCPHFKARAVHSARACLLNVFTIPFRCIEADRKGAIYSPVPESRSLFCSELRIITQLIIASVIFRRLRRGGMPPASHEPGSLPPLCRQCRRPRPRTVPGNRPVQ